jgi:thiol-disulfide isomerase/thioredoxin
MALSPRTKLSLLALVPVALFGLLWVARATTGSTSPEVSGPMPPLAGQAVAGDDVTPGDYRGRVVVVNFWASWCNPCRNEQPGLERLSQEYPGRVAFIGVNHRDDPAAARAYLEEFHVSYPSVLDRAGEVAHEFGVPYLPATVLVDATGEMRYRLVGEQSESTVREHIEELLAR